MTRVIGSMRCNGTTCLFARNLVQTENRGVWEGSIQREFKFWPGEEEEEGGGK